MAITAEQEIRFKGYLAELENEEHLWCRHGDKMRELLIIFESKETLSTLLAHMAKQLRSCVNCITSYHQAVAALREQFEQEKRYTMRSMEIFFDNLLQQDIVRLCEGLNSIDARSENADLVALAFLFYEILHFPQAIQNSAQLSELFAKSIKDLDEAEEVEWKISTKSPGIYMLLMHPDARVRSWATRMVEELGALSKDDWQPHVHPVAEECMRMLEFGALDDSIQIIEPGGQEEGWLMSHSREEFWEGFATFFHKFSPELLEEKFIRKYPSFVDVLINNFQSYPEVFSSTLMCITKMLRLLGYKIWLKASFKPITLIQELFQHSLHGASAENQLRILALFKPLLQSLEQYEGYIDYRDQILLFLTQKVASLPTIFSERVRLQAFSSALSIITESYKSEKNRTVPPPMLSSAIWGPAICKACWNSSLPVQQRSAAIHILKQIINEDLSSLRSFCSSLYFTDETDGTRPKLFWTQEVWNYLLGEANLAKGISHVPLPLQQVIFCTHSDVALLDTEHMPELELQDVRASGVAATEFERVTCSYRSKLARFLQQAATHHDISANFFEDPHVVYALFFYVVDPNKAVREAIANLIVSTGAFKGHMDAILTIALRHVRAFLEGTRDCMRDIADMGISSCFRSWSHLFFYLGKILPGCITAAQEGEVSEDNQSARECIVEVLQIIDTVITTVFITAKQFRERPEYPVTMVRFFEFISVMLPLFSSVWDAGWDERLQSDEAPLVATHDQWFSDFFRFAAESDAGLDKQGLYLLSFQKDLCKNLLRGGTLLDDQKNELAAFFPGVSGNLGLEWHTNLPSSLGAFKPAKEKEKEEEEKEEDEKEEEEGDENGDLEQYNWPHARAQTKPPSTSTTSSLLSSWLSKKEAKPASSTFRSPSAALQMWASSAPAKAIAHIASTSRKKTELDKKRKVDMKSLRRGVGTSDAMRMRISAEERVRSNPRERFKKRNSINSDSQFRRLSEWNFGQEPSVELDNGPTTEIDRKVEEVLQARRAEREQRAQGSRNPQHGVGTKLIQLPGTIPALEQKRRREQEAQRRRELLSPSLDPLHAIILGWDYFNLEASHKREDLRQVPIRFSSAEDYIRIFRPLLVEEFRASLEQDKEEDEFPHVQQVKLSSLDKVDSFHVVHFKYKLEPDRHARDFFENDILLIADQRNLKSGNHLLGLVEGVKTERGADRETQAILKAKILLKGKAQWLRMGQLYFVKKVSRITTTHREFKALMSAAHLHLYSTIMDPASHRPSENTSSRRLPSACAHFIKDRYNPSQLQAIETSLCESDSFVLLQGPPGTGKTKTILGILSSSLIMSRLSQATQTDPNNKRNPVLVCAPSNAAVDEICMRLLEDGLFNETGERYIPRMVRMGVESSVHPMVKAITLASLLDAESDKGNSVLKKEQVEFEGFRTKTDATRKELEQVLKKISALQTELTDLRKRREESLASSGGLGLTPDEKAEFAKESELRRELTELHNGKAKLGKEISRFHETRKKYGSRVSKLRKQMELQILNETDIVLTTLSGSGSDILSHMSHGFETVVIDEAAQAVEMATLIPLKYDCRRCILVGDPNQLPATVISQAASSFLYAQSLFQRLQKAGHPVIMLDVQYRMHPLIREFPSKHFYDNRLTDGPNIDTSQSGLYNQPYHADPSFQPFLFYDLCKGVEEQGARGQSYVNPAEATFCLQLFQDLCSRFPHIEFGGRVGVITPYKQQYFLLQRTFAAALDKATYSAIDINTIDGFQGREKDVIIFSCVRAHETKGIGFLSDIRRMNVALTRAKFGLFVVGKSTALLNNPHWGALVNHAKEKQLYRRVDPSSIGKRPLQQPHHAPRPTKKSRIAAPTPSAVDAVPPPKRPRDESPFDGRPEPTKQRRTEPRPAPAPRASQHTTSSSSSAGAAAIRRSFSADDDPLAAALGPLRPAGRLPSSSAGVSARAPPAAVPPAPALTDEERLSRWRERQQLRKAGAATTTTTTTTNKATPAARGGVRPTPHSAPSSPMLDDSARNGAPRPPSAAAAAAAAAAKSRRAPQPQAASRLAQSASAVSHTMVELDRMAQRLGPSRNGAPRPTSAAAAAAGQTTRQMKPSSARRTRDQ